MSDHFDLNHKNLNYYINIHGNRDIHYDNNVDYNHIHYNYADRDNDHNNIDNDNDCHCDRNRP